MLFKKYRKPFYPLYIKIIDWFELMRYLIHIS